MPAVEERVERHETSGERFLPFPKVSKDELYLIMMHVFERFAGAKQPNKRSKPTTGKWLYK